MSIEIRSFAAVIPAGTPVTAPVTINLTMAPRIVDQIQVRIPPGPNGLVGFRLTASGQQIIPYNPGAWIIGNDELLPWPLTGQITSGAWQLTGYNTGLYDHTIHLRFLLSLAGQSSTNPPPDIIPADDLSAAPEPDLTVPDGTLADIEAAALASVGMTGADSALESGV